MPLVKDVRISQALTNVAIKYMSEAEGFAAPICCPEAPIAQDEMQFPVFDMQSFFLDASEHLERGPGSPYPQGDVKITWTPIRSKDYGHEELLDDKVAKSAAAVLDLESTLTEASMQKVLSAWEQRVATLCTTAANWALSQTLSGGDCWDDFTNSDPDKNIVTGIGYVTRYGKKANTFVIGQNAWQYVRRHPQYRELTKYRADFAKGGVVSPDIFKALYGFENVVIASAVYISTKKGAAVTTLTHLWDDNCWIGYVNPVPNARVPSACYTFALEKIAVEMYRRENVRSTFYRARHDVTEAVSAAGLGTPIVNCVA